MRLIIQAQSNVLAANNRNLWYVKEMQFLLCSFCFNFGRLFVTFVISLQKSASSESMMAMGKMLSEIFDVSLEEAVEVIAIQLTNGSELNPPSMSGRALYPKISFINHSCVPNMAHSHRVVGKQFLHVESGQKMIRKCRRRPCLGCHASTFVMFNLVNNMQCFRVHLRFSRSKCIHGNQTNDVTTTISVCPSVRFLCILRLVMLYQASLSGLQNTNTR